jgi:rhamnogalacturonyl hydrolase YesR
VWAAALFAVFLTASSPFCFSQQAAASEAPPADPGPLAADLSPALHSRQIRAAMRRVADWEFERVQAQPPSRSWDFGTLDIGLVAASRTLGDARLSRYVASVGDHYNWTLERTTNPPNDFALGQALLELCRSSRDEDKFAPIRKQFDDAIALTEDPDKPAWGWCAGLFMQPAAASQLTQLTGDPTYVQYIHREWGPAERLLYDQQKHLFSNDADDLGKHEKNGEKLFSSRGNGWVMAGLARVIATMPSDDPLRAHYIDVFRQMAAAVASVQSGDGLWRPGLLDAKSYPQPEVSGSALLTYALAWGINHRLLDAAVYLPVVENAWRGMLAHIYQDGRLGSMQAIGDPSTAYKPDSSYPFGVGAFLLAGSEVDALSQHKHW